MKPTEKNRILRGFGARKEGQRYEMSFSKSTGAMVDRKRGGIAACAVGVMLLVGLSGCISTTAFKTWNGPAEFLGEGGAFESVDGIDVYSVGSPPRRYQVLGVIENTQYGSSTAIAWGGSYARDAIVAEAKKRGGDAVIFLEDSQEVVGYSESYAASYAAAGSSAGGGYSGGGGTRSRAVRQVAVVRYLPEPEGFRPGDGMPEGD